MRALPARTRSSAIGLVLTPITTALLFAGAHGATGLDDKCAGRPEAGRTTCARPGTRAGSRAHAMAAGDAPAFRVAFVQPFEAPDTWRSVYRAVERAPRDAAPHPRGRRLAASCPWRG